MILLPAIDMKDGRCVRLKKGEFHTVHQVANSALETARRFAEAGAQWVHMVDLDGARDGVRANFPLIYEVIQQSGLRVELGGGVKSIPDVITIVEAGAARAVIGSAAVTDPAVLDYAVNWKPEQIAVGIDCLNGGLGTGLRPGLFGVRPAGGGKGCKDDYLYGYCNRWDAVRSFLSAVGGSAEDRTMQHRGLRRSRHPG